MTADLNKPISTDLYTQILTDIRDMQAALAKMDHSSTANVPINTIQWSDANSRLEKWNGSAWVALMPSATTSAQGLTQLSSSLTSTSTTLAATASTIKTVNDKVDSLDFTDIAGAATAGQVPALSALTGSLTDAQLKRSAVLAGHVRAGNTQIPKNGSGDGVTMRSATINNVLNQTWTSVGPTGSGADVIWTTLDTLPASAEILLVDFYVATSIDDGVAFILEVSVSSGDISSPTSAAFTKPIHMSGKGGATSAEAFKEKNSIMVALSASNTFKLYCNYVNIDTVIMFYKGFMAD